MPSSAYPGIPGDDTELHKTIGPGYLQRLLVPEIGSILRETISKHKAEDLHANDRRAVQGAIYQALVATVGNGIGDLSDDDTADLISLTDVLITEVKLPDTLRDAIPTPSAHIPSGLSPQFFLQNHRSN
jgi:prohibitin 2